MTNIIVVDASVAVKWLCPEEATDKAFEWLGLNDTQLIAPQFIKVEISNVLLKKVRFHAMTISRAHALQTQLHETLPLAYYDTDNYLQRAVQLAVTLNHGSVYDCLYLALSEAVQGKLLTADSKFTNKLSSTPFEKNVINLLSPPS